MIVAEPRTRSVERRDAGRTRIFDAGGPGVRARLRPAAWTAQDGRSTLGVSRHTLWRFLERGHTGRAVPSAVVSKVGASVQAIEAAAFEIVIDLEGLRPDPALRSLRQGLEEALLLLCATPLATVEELSRFGRVAASTLRDRLGKLTERGLVDSVPHQLSVLGTRPAAAVLPHGEGRHRRSHGHRGREARAQGLPGVQAVVPAAGRTAGRRGRALPRRSHGRRRRPARRPGAG